MNSENIILIGGGGHCHSVIDVVEQQGLYKIAGIVDIPERIGSEVLGYPVIGTDYDLPKLVKKYSNAVVTIGHLKTNTLRVKLYKILTELGFSLPTIVSPLAYVSKHAEVSHGTIIMHHAVVNAGAVIGLNCIINTKALVEHDVIIGNHCHISTAAVLNGGVRVYDHCFIGSNTVVVQESVVNGFVKAGSLHK